MPIKYSQLLTMLTEESNYWLETRHRDFCHEIMTRPQIHPWCRGVMTANELTTGKEIVFATMTIREVIGPIGISE